jgi:hypothetical protein
MIATAQQTTLQLLRSGRGEGYRAALRTAAVEDVVACVADDPRWDRQVENRDDYYASLLIQMDADVRPIVERILSLGTAAGESTCWLPIGVLAQMARRGHAAAAAGLALCVRRGEKWRACLDALEAAGGEALLGSVIQSNDIEQLLLSVGAEELADAALVVEAPWETWALALPALRFVIAARADRTAGPKPFSGPVGWLAHRLRVPDSADLLEGASVAELLQAATKPGPIRPIVDALLRREAQATEQALHSAARHGSPRERAVALHVLGRQGCVDYLDDAKEFLFAQTHGASKSDASFLRTSYVRYLEAITPELTLPLARDWLFAHWPLSHAAEQILSQRATPADRRTLEVAGEAALAAGEMYRLCAMLEGLTVIGAAESLPFLIQAYAEAPYSLARSRALIALRPHAKEQAVAELLVESLWDCESEAREIACSAVPLTDLAAARRLNALGADAFEEAEVRRAAAGRGISGSD